MPILFIRSRLRYVTGVVCVVVAPQLTASCSPSLRASPTTEHVVAMATADGEVSSSKILSSRPVFQWANLEAIAVAFCYFEALVRTAEPYKFDEEVARLKSFRNIMSDGGFDEAIYVDFAEEAWDLLHKLANVPVDTGLAIVLETFNDLNLSMAMITYFKVTSFMFCQ